MGTTLQDAEFLQRIAPKFNGKVYFIPASSLDTEEKHRRRFARRNERKLYRRKCDLTGESIISFYKPSAPFKVYSHDAWWSDAWNPLDYGREFDFTRPFFEQFADLQTATPRIGMVVHTCENSEYAPYSVRSKNCYMCVSCKDSEDLKYCYQTHFSKDCIDCSLNWKLELCYECLYCTGLFRCSYCKDCENCSDVHFSEECRGCKNCIGCKNLINKEYCIFNKPVSKEEFEKCLQQLSHTKTRKEWQEKIQAFFLTQPTRATHLTNCERSSGDHLSNCKNAVSSFDSIGLEDCRHGYTSPGGTRDCQDFDYSPGAELCYDSLSVVDSYHALFCLHSWNCKNCYYTDECFSSSDLFGCIGIRNRKFCILNKQYTEEEYQILVPKIIEHMQKTDEWGEFFPMDSSPFAYNETIAQNHFPLSKAEALSKGHKWFDEKEEPLIVDKTIPAEHLPESISAIPDDVLNWAITCDKSKKPFRITKGELEFYRNQNISLPHLHPEERYALRMESSHRKVLWNRTCDKCRKDIQSTYPQNSPEKVFCEECYLAAVY